MLVQDGVPYIRLSEHLLPYLGPNSISPDKYVPRKNTAILKLHRHPF